VSETFEIRNGAGELIIFDLNEKLSVASGWCAPPRDPTPQELLEQAKEIWTGLWPHGIGDG